MNAEVGGGTLCPPDWINIDPRHPSSPEFARRIQDGVPAITDNSVDYVKASHVLEHISAGDDRINAMNEVYRILKPGAIFEIIVPCVAYTDHAGDKMPKYNGWQAFADPTHVSFWFYPESFWYFIKGRPGANADYGIRYWEEESMNLVDGWEAHVKLRKPQV